MPQEVHYEIFRRQGAKGGWIMHDVSSNRDQAIALAEELMRNGRATGVKVIKETYSQDTGDYLTLKIFEEGHNKHKTEPAQEDVPHALPCFKPEDLYSYHARATIARLLIDFLARHKITVTELIHRADMLEKFEATGTLYQFAVQKIAVAQASSSKVPVQQIIKSLNELTERAIQRVYRDSRRGHFPIVASGKFVALAQKLSGEADGLYILNGAIARHLFTAKDWNEKLMRLLGLVREAQAAEESPGRTLLFTATDVVIAELLNGSAALHELIGESENLATALMRLVAVYLGEAPQDGGTEALGALALHFARDELADSRTAVANRILVELKSVKRLCPRALDEELKALRRMANKLVLGQGKYLSHEDLIAAFTLRSKRLITRESIANYLADVSEPEDRVERLLSIEENIIGSENKRQLAKSLIPILTSSAFGQNLVLSKAPPLPRLKRLADLQKRVHRSGFQENQKQEISEILDRLANEAETRGKVLEGIEQRPGSHVEKAITVLRLCTTGVLTEGRLSTRARAIVLSHLGKPGFLSGYIAHFAKSQADESADKNAALSDLVKTLEKAGITPETGLRNIAA